jgi:uncharacterized membrane protein YcaP (DUF421 family)
MWIFDWTLLEIVFRTVIIYILVLAGLRLTGKREVGQMTPLDLVLVLLIANAVQNAMTGPDNSLTGGLVAALTLLAINTLLTRLIWRNRKLRRWVEGSPTLLVHRGTIVKENLEKEKVTHEELHQAFREHGILSLSEVSLAVLEVDGSISVLKSDEMPVAQRPHHRIRFLHRPPP